MNSKEHENKRTRVVWSTEFHQKFVDAVNQLGIDEAKPRKILELMNDKMLTKQHVASHLQKYKLHLKRISNSMANQQQLPCVQNGQELPSNGFQNGVGLTPTLEAFRNQTIDTFIDNQVTYSTSCCGQCSQVLYEIANLKQEIVDDRDKKRHFREVMQAMKIQQENMLQIVSNAIPPSSRINLSHPESASMS